MVPRSGFGSQLRPTVNARFVLMYAFHRVEKKCGDNWDVYQRCFGVGGPSTQRLTAVCNMFITQVVVLAVEVTSVDGWRWY